MPIHRIESRARFQGPSKKTKHCDGAKPQYKPTHNVVDIVPRSLLREDMVDEELFKKKRVPSTGELGNALKSNLRSSLAAEKAYLEQHNGQDSQPLLVRQHFDYVQEDGDDPPAARGYDSRAERRLWTVFDVRACIFLRYIPLLGR